MLLGIQMSVASVIPLIAALMVNLDERIGEFHKSSDPAQRRLQRMNCADSKTACGSRAFYRMLKPNLCA